MEEEQKWVDSRYFFGASLFSKLENDQDGQCVEGYSNWYLINGTETMFSEKMEASCREIKSYCCHTINISSGRSQPAGGANLSQYEEQALASLGTYHAIGIVNGRYAYQMAGEDRFLEYGTRYWLASTGVGKTSGHIHHHGGSVCPEHIKGEWQISSKDEAGDWVWTDDLELKVSCAKHTTDPAAAGLALPHMAVQRSAAASPALVVLTFLTLLLLALLVIIIARRAHRAWGSGAQGKQLLLQTLDL